MRLKGQVLATRNPAAEQEYNMLRSIYNYLTGSSDKVEAKEAETNVGSEKLKSVEDSDMNMLENMRGMGSHKPKKGK